METTKQNEGSRSGVESAGEPKREQWWCPTCEKVSVYLYVDFSADAKVCEWRCACGFSKGATVIPGNHPYDDGPYPRPQIGQPAALRDARRSPFAYHSYGGRTDGGYAIFVSAPVGIFCGYRKTEEAATDMVEALNERADAFARSRTVSLEAQVAERNAMYEGMLERADASRAKLVEALTRYGRHDLDCPCRPSWTDAKCTCGLNKALEDLKC